MQNKTVVITGANRGIGLSLCKFYVERGFDVYAVCRKQSQELSALNLQVIDRIDVSSEQDTHTPQPDASDLTTALVASQPASASIPLHSAPEIVSSSSDAYDTHQTQPASVQHNLRNEHMN